MIHRDIKLIATRINNGDNVAARLQDICRRMNIAVYFRELPDKVKALTLRESPITSNYIMVVNTRSNYSDRRRSERTHQDRRWDATIAHEIGHVALGHFFSENTLLAQLKNDKTKRQMNEDAEADAFAVELQMPAALTKTLLQSGTGIKEMQKIFNVSRKAMNNRVEDLYCGSPACGCKVLNKNVVQQQATV